ncbi:MAG: penicillin-binding protein [Anaerolineales bacterium]
MKTVTQIIRQRRRREQALRRNPLPTIGWIAGTIVSLLFTFFTLGFGWLVSGLLSDLPPIERVELFLNTQNGGLKNPTRFFARDGKTLLASLEHPNIQRLWLDLPDSSSPLPKLALESPLARAVIASLEPDFSPNPALSFRDFATLKLNTISQRLAYDLLLWDETPSWRKILRAKILGAQLNQRYGKLQTLIWYLNSAKFGPLIYGAETAAQLYFNKSAAELDMIEAAALVSILESPGIHPLNAPEVVRKRTGDILVRLIKSGWMRSEEIGLANLENLKFAPSSINLELSHPVYVAIILQQLSELFPLEVVERGGWDILTTIDPDLQHNLECTLQVQMSRIAHTDNPFTSTATDCPAALLLPGVASSNNVQSFPLQAQGIIIDPTTNQVLALASVAQISNSKQPFENKSLENHVGGTILTPFIYLAAFSRGIQPATLQWDIPPDSDVALPNLDGRFHGPLRARIALANDYFAPALSLLNQIGAETILNIIQQLGINLKLAEKASDGALVPDQFFFSSKVSILEIAQAYQVLANQGILSGWIRTKASFQSAPQVYPILIQKASEQNGKTLFDLDNDQSALENRSVISPELAYLLTHVLADEAARWQTFGHPNPFEIGRRSAAKLGRAFHPNQYWAVGYTPQRLVAVWLGNEQNPELSLKPSSVMNLWHALMQYSSQKFPASDWTMPPTLLRRNVCDPSGMLPDADCPSIVSEIFISGFEPRQTDQLFQTYLVNEQTGRLATVFTPLELVKEQRYMIIPPEARQWASAEGIPLPPKEYDRIQSPSIPSQNAQITSPQMFSYVRGVVPIVGSAGGDGFQYYRLQVGEGLFPRRWIQIGSDQPNPVKAGKLGSWDTQGLNGLYTLQLQVIGKENRVETALLQLTVDNTPPTLSIPFPESGKPYSIKEFPTLTVQIQAADDLGIQKVELFLDGEAIHIFTQPPYAFPWQSRVGSHRIVAVVYDLAGNASQAEVVFKITD